MTKEIVVISGKGGTGKTSVTASFAALAKKSVIADCDVDAADLHLVLKPQVQSRFDFYSGKEAIIREESCNSCGVCFSYCRYDAVIKNQSNGHQCEYQIDPLLCEGCGVCVEFCPRNAIEFPERLCGEWYVSATRFGTMVHAKLGIGAENSGKLVSLVRREARNIAHKNDNSFILVDGPPGIGCPVIASITDTSGVLVVTEPTLSGEHDLERVLQLTKHFKIKTMVCVNKFDINFELTERIEKISEKAGAVPIGRIPYDPVFSEAQVNGKSVIEQTQGKISKEIENIWSNLNKVLN